MPPGTILHSLARRICSERAMQLMVEPAIADLQHELQTASRTPDTSTLAAAVRGYAALLAVIAMAFFDSIRPDAHDYRRFALLVMLSNAGATAALVIAMVTLPIHTDWSMGHAIDYQIARAIPLAIAGTIPFVVAWACRAARPTPFGVVLLAVFLISVSSFAVARWVTPTLMAPVGRYVVQSGVYGVFTGPGPRMHGLETREKRQQAMAASPTRSVTMSSRFLSYTNGSMAVAPIVLAAVVMAAFWRKRPTGPEAITVAAGVALAHLSLAALVDNLYLYPISWRIVETKPFNWFPLVVWIPNVVFALIALVVWTRNARGSMGKREPIPSSFSLLPFTRPRR